MRVFRTMDAGASGMTAERLRMDIIASNIANANSTRTEAGGPYRRKMPVFAEDTGADGPKGVRVVAVRDDQSPLKRVHDPGHPDAGSDGYVMFPNVEPVREMVDLITAMRAYEANATLVSTAKALASKALEIGRG
ncbi:MAG: flagellar basal body rod protein FlgC [Bacillota bacterium]|nr:flagellar basal body rod protein FlgC [Bacillota bacterium]